MHHSHLARASDDVLPVQDPVACRAERLGECVVADGDAGPAGTPGPDVARMIVSESSKYWRSISASVAESIVWYVVALLIGGFVLAQMRVEVMAGISGSAA